jgi:integrase
MGHQTASVGDLRDSLRHLFPPVKGEKQHFAAMPYPDIPAFVQALRQHQAQGEALSPSVIEFILLTAARENEVWGMRRGEVDWQERVWTLPAARSKTAQEHRVPLSNRTMELLARQRGPTLTTTPIDPHGYVWPGRDGAGPVTGKSVYKYLTQTMGVKTTIHGFRATFRTWAGNETNFDRVTCDMCLGHKAGDQVELAYRRGDALAKRRQLMDQWAAYCEGR